MRHLFILTFITFNSLLVYSQVNEAANTSSEIKGIILSSDENQPLPYANIFVIKKHTGTISNERGLFSVDINGLIKTDTIRFQYVGYKTKLIVLEQLLSDSVVFLEADIINLSELVVFGTEPDVRDIVKNILKYKDSNYRKITTKRQAFIRDRDIADFTQFKLNYKKSSIDEIDRETIALAEEKIPKNVTSYTDFLGYLYFNKNQDDTIKFKIDPLRTVTLEEQDITELEEIAKVFENAFANTNEDEYWRIKSGIFGSKLDSADISIDPESDTIEDNQHKLKYYRNAIRWKLAYSSLNDKKEWEFLHSTGKYKYKLAGGTRVNGEEVYIIDFTPKSGGKFEGRMFVAISTYALIRADYHYAPDKTGTNIHLLGVGYSQNGFSGSIYFEKNDGNYLLKYFSKKVAASASFNRNVALLKKRKRWLFDKKLKEIKIGMDLKVNMEQSVEMLMIDNKTLTKDQFDEFNENEYLEVIFVDQFDEDLWKDYPIIEPTVQMREYKKQNTD